MSGREIHLYAVSVTIGWLLVMVLVWPSLALAIDISSQFDDPLRAVPKVIEKGVTMPGDLGPTLCPAQKDFTAPLALGEAADLALCNNPQIRTAWANIKIQAGAVGEARAAYLPTLSGTLSRIDDKTSYPGSGFAPTTITSTTVYGTATWRIFDFGSRSANRQASESLLVAALATHEAILQKTLTAVIEAYFDAVTARAVVNAKTQNEAIARQSVASAQRREVKGDAAQSDTLQAMTALAKASLEKSRAQAAYRKALSVLAYTLGIPGTTVISLSEDADENTGVATAGLLLWLEEAQKKHPAIIAARAALEAAKNRVASARSEGLPTLDLSSNLYRNGRPYQTLTPIKTQEVTAGVVLTIPIFEGFSRTYKIQGAQAQVEKKEAELADAEYQVVMEVVKAHADAASSLQNLLASDELLKAARSALAASQRKYDKGAADILEILNTQSALADAQLERIRCVAEWHSSRLRLLASAGQMGRAAAGK